MKFKKIMLVSIFLLAILTIGAVCASEDANQTLTADDDIDLGASNDDVVVGDDDKVLIDSKYYDYVPDSFLEDSQSEDYVYVEFSGYDYSLDGNLSVSLDENEIHNQRFVSSEQIFYTDIFEDATWGSHNLTFRYFGDTHYADFIDVFPVNYIYYRGDIPETATMGSGIDMEFAEDVTGTFDVYVDNNLIDSLEVSDGGVYFNLDADTLGEHTYKVKFTSDDPDTYPSFTKSGKYNLDYCFEINCDENEIGYGETVSVEVYLPSDAQNKLKVTYNGKTTEYAADEEGMIFLRLDNLKIGENKISFTYPKDSQYPTRTKYLSVYVKEVLNIAATPQYQSGEGIYFKIAEDAVGKLNVTIDGVSKLYDLNKGTVSVDLSNEDPKVSHYLLVSYTGSDYAVEGYENGFYISPNFEFKETVWVEEGFKVSLTLPDDANGTLMVNVDKHNRTVDVVNGKASVVFDDLEVREYQECVIEYEGNYFEKIVSTEVNVRRAPPNINLTPFLRESYLKGAEYDESSVLIADYAEGHVNITVDGKLLGKFTVNEDIIYINDYTLIEDLEIGTHAIRFDYSGDDYYLPATCSTSFEVSFCRVDCPNEVILGDMDGFCFRTVPDASGSAVLTIDGKTIKPLVDDNDDDKTYWFDLKDLPCGEYTAKLTYSGDKKYGSFTKELKFNLTYETIMEGTGDVIYGDEIPLNITFTVNVTGNATVRIADKEYNATIENGSIAVVIEDLPIGQYNFTVTVDGDDKFPSKVFTGDIEVAPKVKMPEGMNMVSDNYVSLVLPSDAEGALNVTIYEEDESGNERLVSNYLVNHDNGKFNVSFNDLTLGSYHIISKYTGDDYDVGVYETYFSLRPKITVPNVIYVGDTNANITVELPSDASGTLLISIDGEELDVDFKNGIGVAKLPELEWGDEKYFTISYEGDAKYGSYFSNEDYYVYVSRHDPQITAVPQKEIIANNYIDVAFTLPSDATGTIQIVNTASVKGGKATVKVFVPKAGENTFSYYYSGDSKYEETWGSFTVNALKAPTLTMKAASVYYTAKATFKVKVLDSFGKLVKGKYVTFYINGKKVKSIKTDSKGYATFKISKNPGTYNVKAAYKGGVVTKKLTVKHVVTLKKATVKKSAKKLVLQVTLKKGKTPLKNKKVTFRFNGKNYKAKTNKKGVAKVTIKKATLKKLKVGKTVKYQATYLKDTVKKSAKVKK